MINIVKDIDLFDHISEYDAIIIGVNTMYSMRHGFQRKVSLNYPYVMEENLKTKYGDKEKMGKVIECKRNNQPTFLLCFITNGLNTRPDLKTDNLSYDSLSNCLKIINVLYKGKNLACTLLGNSKFDGNGDRERILKIFDESCTDINLTIYDYEQKSRDDMIREERERELKIKAIDYSKYREMVKQRKEKEKIIKNLNGHAKK